METVLNPLLYIAFAIVVWHGFRLRAQHRRHWGISLFSPGRISVIQLLTAVAVGTVWSTIIVLSEWDAGLSLAHVWWLWAVVILLGLVRVRFMGFSYAAGAVSLLALVSQWLDASVLDSVSRSWVLSLQSVDVKNLLLLASGFIAISGLLMIWSGDHSYFPVLLAHRGKSIGAIALQALWAVPLLLHTSNGWLILPALLVYSDLAVTRYAKQRARITGMWTVAFGIVLAVLSFTSLYIEAFLWVGAMWSLIGQEVMIRLSDWQERNGVPKFRSPGDGIRVLAVKADSPAAEMGILPGETITHANGQAVRNMTELYAALQMSPAFCKLEVVNEDHEQRFAQRSLYANEPHQLGIIPVGESAPVEGRLPHRLGWWTLFMGRTDYRGNVTENRLEG